MVYYFRSVMNLENRVINVLRKAGKETAMVAGVLAGGVAVLYAVVVGGSLALAKVSGVEIVHPWTPPRVEIHDSVLTAESRVYSDHISQRIF